MAIYLRPFETQTDAPRIAELLNTNNASAEPITAERLTEEYEQYTACGRISWRVVAVEFGESGERIVGYGSTGHDTCMSVGRYWLEIVVDTAAQTKGAGTMIYDDLAQFAWEQGAASLEVWVSDCQPHGRRFIEHRGFYLDRCKRNAKMLVMELEQEHGVADSALTPLLSTLPYLTFTELGEPDEAAYTANAQGDDLLLDMAGSCC